MYICMYIGVRAMLLGLGYLVLAEAYIVVPCELSKAERFAKVVEDLFAVDYFYSNLHFGRLARF